MGPPRSSRCGGRSPPGEGSAAPPPRRERRSLAEPTRVVQRSGAGLHRRRPADRAIIRTQVMDEDTTIRRRLSAILAADIAGYSRLMGQDETATVRELK